MWIRSKVYHTLTFVPCLVVLVLLAKSQTTNASKYVGITGVFSKWSNCQSFSLSVLLMGIFEIEMYLGSCAKVTVNVAFSAGSSKQGNVLRASVG